jgi:protein-S-isoprenylcysteine O-methyltransferase Ste14
MNSAPISTSEETLRTGEQAIDIAVLVLSALLGVGSIVLFATLSSVRWIDLGWSDPLALTWNALLSLAFFVQHSGMVRRPVRARLAQVWPARYQVAAYSIASGVVLALVVVFWQHSDTRLYVLGGVPRLVAQGLSLVAAIAFVLAIRSLRRSFDPLGLRPIRAHLRGQPDRQDDLVVRGPYLWVRHPLYSCILVLLWAQPAMTADQLLLASVWSAWIWVGAVLEERDLVAEFGDSYRAYQRQVPMLVPWRGRVTLAGG